MKDTLIEVVYGKKNKFEIYRRSTLFGWEFVIYKDGKYFSSSSTLPKAISKVSNL